MFWLLWPCNEKCEGKKRVRVGTANNGKNLTNTWNETGVPFMLKIQGPCPFAGHQIFTSCQMSSMSAFKTVLYCGRTLTRERFSIAQGLLLLSLDQAEQTGFRFLCFPCTCLLLDLLSRVKVTSLMNLRKMRIRGRAINESLLPFE